jgi:hypothetical protein
MTLVLRRRPFLRSAAIGSGAFRAAKSSIDAARATEGRSRGSQPGGAKVATTGGSRDGGPPGPA